MASSFLMFHAPTAEAKTQKDVRGNRPAPEPVRELSPFVPDMVGPVSSGAAANGAGAPRANHGGIARQLADLHSMYGNQAILRTLSHAPAVIQTKLAVNKPGDEFEQEADRVADQVMRMTAAPPSVQRKCSSCAAEEEKVQRKCAECEQEEKQTGLQRKESAAGPRFAPPSVGSVLNSPGRPLDAAARAFMEPRFGFDFGRVRVHDDPRAAQSARSVNALAYTVGNNVVFNTNQYQPGSSTGQRLLAHELAHVIQQSKAAPSSVMREDAEPQSSLADCNEKCGKQFEECKGKRDPTICQAELSSCLHFCDAKNAPQKPEEAPPQPAPTPPAAAAKQAVTGTDSKGQDFVVYEKEIRVGGTRPWRNNNPGNFDKPGDHPKNIGTDGRFLIFPDPATGKQELIDSVKAHGTSSIRSFCTVHAPPSENDTEKYIREVVSFLNNGSAIEECKITKPAKPVSDGTLIGDLSDSEQASLAMAMAREEGWCPVALKKAIYNCQSTSIPDEYKGKLTCP